MMSAPSGRVAAAGWQALIGALAVLFCVSAQAHRPSESYLQLQTDAVSTTWSWDIPLADLVLARDLDVNGDGQLQWGELRAQQETLWQAAGAWLQWRQDGNTCGTRPQPLMLIDRFGETHLHLRGALTCADPQRPPDALRYTFLSTLDPDHRLRLRATSPAGEQMRRLPASADWQALPEATGGLIATLVTYLIEGVWHIWIGLDHILFLLALLLPSVLVYRQRRWQPVGSLRPALVQVLLTVTAFTVAHSLTLSAAVLGWIAAPVMWVEAAIALSVMFAAVNNVVPVVTRRVWLLALGFGLIHGFGFAFVLADLGLPTDQRIVALLAFNLGVELGQVAIVLGILPLMYLLRHTAFYRRYLRVGGSLAVAVLALYWFVDRVS